MLIGFVQGYEELKWGISKLNPLCNGPLETRNGVLTVTYIVKDDKKIRYYSFWSHSNGLLIVYPWDVRWSREPSIAILWI